MQTTSYYLLCFPFSMQERQRTCYNRLGAPNPRHVRSIVGEATMCEHMPPTEATTATTWRRRSVDAQRKRRMDGSWAARRVACAKVVAVCARTEGRYTPKRTRERRRA